MSRSAKRITNAEWSSFMETFKQLHDNLIERIRDLGQTRIVSGRKVREILDMPVSIPPNFIAENLTGEHQDYVSQKLRDYEDELHECIDRLKDDITTRQAVMQFDTGGSFPNCTVAIHFQIRSGMLTTSVFQRSMDVKEKFGQDYTIFRLMSHEVQDELNVDWRGTTIYITNAHYYL